MTNECAFEAFADEEEGWDQETNAPGILTFANAIQVWSLLQGDEPVSIAQAARAFNSYPALVAEAVEAHPWMMVIGDDSADYEAMFIEHEGE